MDQILFSLPVRNKRDAMIARQRTRQLAGLLGFDVQEQASLAAEVFAAAWQILSLHAPVRFSFLLESGMLQVAAQAPKQCHGDSASGPGRQVVLLERGLPARAKVSIEDLHWAVDKLDQITPAHMYEEVYRLNQELLATMQALQTCQAQLNLLGKGEKPSAA